MTEDRPSIEEYPFETKVQAIGFRATHANVASKLALEGKIVVFDVGAGWFTVFCESQQDATGLATLGLLGLFTV